MYPRLWAESFASVLTFEPCPDNYSVLLQNCAAVSDRVKATRAALGIAPGKMPLHRVDMNNVGMHSIHVRPGVAPELTISVPVVTVDQLRLERLDLVQLDVEQYESEVLTGAVETLRRLRPVLVLETVDQNGQAILDSLGYAKVAHPGPDSVWVTGK